MLRLLHPLDRRLDGVDPRLDPPRGRHLPRRLGLGVNLAALLQGAALEGRPPPGRSASCAAPTPPPGRSSPAANAARREMVVLDVDHPTSRSSSGARRARRRGARARGGRLRHVARLADWSSIQCTNANNSVRVTDAFMEAVEADRLEPHGPHRRGRPGDGPTRKLLHDMAEAAWRCADPGVQYGDDDQLVHTLSRRINAIPDARSTCRSTTRRATSPR